jgi:hypothetical protein
MMTNIILSILVLGTIICLLWVNFKLNLEIRRNRILQSFISGIIRSISDYHSRTDGSDELPERVTQLPIPYSIVLENISYELSKDQLLEHYENWLKTDRLIFYNNKFGSDGFNFMYLDLFDKRLKEWFKGNN